MDQSARTFWNSQAGSVALIFSLALPALVLAGAIVVDAASLNHQEDKLQSIADATALAMAKELHLFSNKAAIQESGRSRAAALLAEAGLAHRPHEIRVRADTLTSRVDVELELVGESFLPAEASGGETPISVAAQAQSYGKVQLCVLGLNRKSSETVLAQNGAVLAAPDCAVQSNSTDPNGLMVKNLSSFVSAFTCTSGGYAGSLASYLPPPQTDCPPIADPLSSRLPPEASGCDFSRINITAGVKTISPGVYCNGITITNKAVVTALPGLYVIKGGMLEVGKEATLKGEYVSFYFADDAATFLFKDASTIDLGASKDGALAGLLFFEDPIATPGRAFEISSTNARKLLGTIYLPRGVFRTGRSGSIGSISAYTVIVADRIDMAGATLVINADYGGSDVPVPTGLGPSSGEVRLVH